jgi:hypothetical protein
LPFAPEILSSDGSKRRHGAVVEVEVVKTFSVEDVPPKFSSADGRDALLMTDD